MNLRPMNDRVIVKREKYDEHADSEIIAIVDTGRISIFAQVVAVGPKVSTLAAGDRVVLSGWQGKTVRVDGEELLVLAEEDIGCVVE